MKLLFCLLVILGAQRTSEYVPMLEGKTIALFSNHTGIVPDESRQGGYRHTLDVLLENGLDVRCVFAPEHGFRGTAGPGEKVDDSIDPKTGIEIRSLYKGGGAIADLDGIDVIVSDIQDVGTRFYTYYVTMISLMEAAASEGKGFVVFDRPNPNGMYIDGPILRDELRSGVGRLPIPVVHGLTLGEMAIMANEQGWLKNGLKLKDLKVIKCQGYTHDMRYELPVRPSPNLPNMHSIYLYPSLCMFEATKLSVGRGTAKAFQMYGDTDLSGLDDEKVIEAGLDLSYIIGAWKESGFADDFLSPWFEKLIGTPEVRRLILEGRTSGEIKETWKAELGEFRLLREQYLLYP